MLDHKKINLDNVIDPKYINKEFIDLFNRPGPYYSSYPILAEWKLVSDGFDHEKTLVDYFRQNPNNPVHIYLHIPYCAKLCYYCSCRMHISNNRKTINDFVQVLIKEINMLDDFFNKNKITPNIKEIHLGGGTPSHLSVEELSLIIENLKKFTDIKKLVEFSMEIDPRTVNVEHFDHYASFGIDRISFGVQDFDPEVQKKINRIQPYELIEELMVNKIKKQFKGVNFDLLYGLPGQSLDTFRKTINLTTTLSPERITLIKYAHIPEKRKHMKMIDSRDFPPEEDLPLMFVESTKTLTNAGYEWVGIDHFAKQDDELAIAKKNGTVYRNFGGETPGKTKDIICLGPTSTFSFGKYYAQSTYDLHKYRDSVGKGIFPISKNYELNDNDLLRRECNFSLQCNQLLDINKIEEKYNINFDTYFSKEIAKIKEYEKSGFLSLVNNKIQVTTLGRYFVRHICQIFDTFIYEEPYYSKGP